MALKEKRRTSRDREISVGKSAQGVQAGQNRYMVIPRVLIFIFNNDDVLLLKGAPTKRIWANRYNGIGGHVEANEDIYTAARREIYEETGLEVHDLRLRGVVNVDVGSPSDGAPTGIILFVFSARSEGRETVSSVEGMLEWVPLVQLPSHDLVEDIPVLLDRITKMSDNSLFFAHYWYDEQEQLRIEFTG